MPRSRSGDGGVRIAVYREDELVAVLVIIRDTTTATVRIAIPGTTTKAVPTKPGRRLSTKHIGNSPA
jgi:hypothetical protein